LSVQALPSPEDRIEAVRRNFVSWAKAQRADVLAHAAKAAAGDRQAIAALHSLAHRLRGTGGTLSFDEIVEPARLLEVATGTKGPMEIGPAAERLAARLAELREVGP
jgi:HPt (histidine-containing phosphotransfer) domain-containing protein